MYPTLHSEFGLAQCSACRVLSHTYVCSKVRHWGLRDLQTSIRQHCETSTWHEAYVMMLWLNTYDWNWNTNAHRQHSLPVVGILMPSFCQVMVGLGEPVALQGRVMGLFRITSRMAGWYWITGSSEERDGKRVMLKKNNVFRVIQLNVKWMILHCAQRPNSSMSLSIVSQDVLTLHCQLHVAVGGTCSILGCAGVASCMTELSWGDFDWT